MDKKTGKYIKLGILVLFSCLTNSSAKAADSSSGGGVKSFFGGVGELFGVKSGKNEDLKHQLEELRAQEDARKKEFEKTQQELVRARKEEESLRQEKEAAERAAQASKKESILLQGRLDTQQVEIERLQGIEANAKAEHVKHVEADKLAAKQLVELERLGEKIKKLEEDVAGKNLTIQEKEEELKRKQDGSKAHKKITGELTSLRKQLGDTQAEGVRLTAVLQKALEQDRKRQAAKDQAEHDAREAQFEREKAEEEHKRIEAEQQAKQLEQQLAEGRLKIANLEQERIAKEKELLETRHKAEKDSDLTTQQAEKIAALEQKLKEKDQEAAREHDLHQKAEEHLTEEKRDHFKSAIQRLNADTSTETELLAHISDPSAFFSDSTPAVYQAFKEKVKADDTYGSAHDLAVSQIMMHSKTADIKDSWTKFIVSMPAPADYRGDNVPLKLVATLHETLKKQLNPDLILDAYAEISENVLANGGCFGINFKRSATDDELKVMIPALRLTGIRAAAKATLAEALKVILSAYWHIEYSAATGLQPDEVAIFESRKMNTTLAAAQALKSKYDEDEILEDLEAASVISVRAYAKGMWAYYDRFNDEKLS